MKRSFYGGYYGATERPYKKRAVEVGSTTRAPRAAVQGSKTAMVRFTRRYNKSGPRRRLRRGKFFRRRIPTLQPSTKTIQLKSTLLQGQDGAAGALTVSTYALNGCYDPWLAEGSTQPLGFDQWTALYRKYCVIGWKARIEVVTTDNTNPVVVGFCPMTTSTALTSYQQYKETPGNKSIVLTQDFDHTEFWVKGGVERYLLGSKRRGRMLTDDQLYAAYDANPTRVLYGHLYSQSMTNAADVANLVINITLYQTVVFFEPIIPNRS